ncbi:MAG: thiol reductase thioredoxin [Spirochaetales bacterium]|nr:thiol reductase thioredoxin [Spirochaetales bacterium]
MTTQEIDTRIHELEDALAHPKTYPTEIYTRIVGYYRSLANWNAGKREEYNHRKTFAEDDRAIHEALDRASTPDSAPVLETESSLAGSVAKVAKGVAASYRLYWRALCPNCPAMKAKATTLALPSVSYDVDSAEGYRSAEVDEVTSTPTLILLDAEGHELTRIVNVSHWNTLSPYLA